jgi:DNA-directed RNA polymerase subunit RPC12/RpoP
MSPLSESLRSAPVKGAIVIAACVGSLLLVIYVARSTFGNKDYRGDWVCMRCEHEFSSANLKHPPMPCPRCDGEAAKLLFRHCPHCGEQVAWARTILTKESQKQRDEIHKRVAEGDMSAVPSLGVLMLPMEIQYPQLQDDGGIDWSPWVLANSHEGQKVLVESPCPQCKVVMPPLGGRTKAPKR